MVVIKLFPFITTPAMLSGKIEKISVTCAGCSYNSTLTNLSNLLAGYQDTICLWQQEIIQNRLRKGNTFSLQKDKVK